MLSLFKTKPLITDEQETWLLETFCWALEMFDSEFFVEEAQLVLPTPAFFPKSVNSIEEMAQHVFSQVMQFSGMSKWPIKLVAPQQMIAQSFPLFGFKGRVRGEEAAPYLLTSAPSSSQPLTDYSHGYSQAATWSSADYSVSAQQQTIPPILVSYNPQQINQPQDLIASFSQALALILIKQGQALPPGGEALIPQAADLVSCFLGYGVMLGNTAYHFRGGCGSCYNPYANRQAALSEPEVMYALALFAKLKKIDKKHVLPHLKSHLRGQYKRASKMVFERVDNSANPLLQSLL
ncbi:hypothetical protein [Flocculibacter collagenilyticus]|uniref:hypothetical protein n=1 Tax=Flocculibacter collagenilyticus TaxID=2744479 RepID=UPI0018F6C5F5|nr:hypothetical protein [Flocculibacter collagenilyticus]